MNNLPSDCYSGNSGLIKKRFSSSQISARPAVMFTAGAALTISVYYSYLSPYYLLLLLFLPLFNRAGILFFLFGIFAGLLTSISSDKTSELPKYFSRPCQIADMDIEITDRRLSNLSNVTNPPLVIADALCYYTNNKRLSCTGKIMLKFPDGEKIPAYGSIINLQGVIKKTTGSYIQCEKIDSPNHFELLKTYNPFQNYMNSKNIYHIFYVEKFTILNHHSEFWSKVITWRDKILRPLTRNLKKYERDLASGFFLGVTGGLTRDAKSNFISSGTVHLFAVSGLHIGILALLLRFCFRTSSFRINSLIIGIAVWIYVIITGANPPAVRAGGMISILCLLRFFRKYISNLDAWAIFAGILLLINPKLLSDIGFLYSFIITLVIIYIVRWHQTADSLHYTLGNLIKEPRKRKKFMKQFKFSRNIKWSLLSTITVFSAGAGISIATQSMLLPGAILANIVILPFLPLFFGFALFKIAIEILFPFFSTYAAIPLSKAFLWLEKSAEFFAKINSNISVMEPAIPEILLYYGGLLWFLTSSKKKWIGLAVSFSLCTIWIIGTLFHPDRILIITTDSTTPISLAMMRNSKHNIDLMNVPGLQHANAINYYCKKFGIREIKTLTVDQLKDDRITGLNHLNGYFMSFNQIYLPPNKKNNSNNISYEKFLKHINRMPYLHCNTITTDSELKLSQIAAANNINIYSIKPAPHLSPILIREQNTDCGKIIKIKINDKIFSAVCPYSNIATVLELPLESSL